MVELAARIRRFRVGRHGWLRWFVVNVRFPQRFREHLH